MGDALRRSACNVHDQRVQDEQAARDESTGAAAMTKFKTGLGKIERVECDRETETMVWVNGRGYKKLTSYESYFDSWNEAKAHMIRRAEEDVKWHERQLDAAKSKLANARALQEVK